MSRKAGDHKLERGIPLHGAGSRIAASTFPGFAAMVCAWWDVRLVMPGGRVGSPFILPWFPLVNLGGIAFSSSPSLASASLEDSVFQKTALLWSDLFELR